MRQFGSAERGVHDSQSVRYFAVKFPVESSRMVSAPDVVIACPHCHAPARLFQLVSGETFGAITWTDGWQDVPLQPRPPRITRCRACSRAYWTGEAKILGHFYPQGENIAPQNAWVTV